MLQLLLTIVTFYAGLHGNFDIVCNHFSRISQPQHARCRMVCSTRCPCLSDADWCLRSEPMVGPITVFRTVSKNAVEAMKKGPTKSRHLIA